MIDAHSHVLPNMDDGSSGVDESAAMLSSLYGQGVTTVAATPHFYAYEMSPSEFFEKRQTSFNSLKEVLDTIPIDLRQGAEVLYFEGLQSISGLKDFCISGTELFLLEMPFSRWSERTIRGVADLNREGGLTVVLAHIDRYLAAEPVAVFEKLAENGVLMQMNASYFLDWRTRKKALRLYENGLVNFIGSDCHNMTHRPPKIAAAVACLEKKLGREAVMQLQDTEGYWFYGTGKAT